MGELLGHFLQCWGDFAQPSVFDSSLFEQTVPCPGVSCEPADDFVASPSYLEWAMDAEEHQHNEKLATREKRRRLRKRMT